MRNCKVALATVWLVTLVACGQSGQPASETTAPAEQAPTVPEVSEIVPGLTMRMLRVGAGDTAASGDVAVVHYTGWLFDEAAADNRGLKFDSSVDRRQHFRFPLGAGRVIKGWDQGVTGMRVGEIRELTIAPDLAYGERGAGAVIPPGSTLIFEVELVGIEGRTDPQ